MLAHIAVPGLTANAWLVGLSFAVAGFGVVLWNVVTVSLRQRIVPDALLGRLNASYRLLAWGSQPIGALLGGLIGEALGLPAVFLIAGVGARCCCCRSGDRHRRGDRRGRARGRPRRPSASRRRACPREPPRPSPSRYARTGCGRRRDPPSSAHGRRPDPRLAPRAAPAGGRRAGGHRDPTPRAGTMIELSSGSASPTRSARSSPRRSRSPGWCGCSGSGAQARATARRPGATATGSNRHPKTSRATSRRPRTDPSRTPAPPVGCLPGSSSPSLPPSCC